MRKKLQVFISSTYKDLIEERQAAVEAVLSAGHIPAGMELFKSGDESQKETIKKWIDESDVYLLILGGRYGTIEPMSGKSYTHWEYEYAEERGIPRFSVVIQETALEKKSKILGAREVYEFENTEKFNLFKNEVLNKTSEFFEDLKDIKLTITGKLLEYRDREDLTGWISGRKVQEDEQMTEELQRLIQENKELKELNSKLLLEKSNIDGEESRIENNISSNVKELENRIEKIFRVLNLSYFMDDVIHSNTFSEDTNARYSLNLPLSSEVFYTFVNFEKMDRGSIDELLFFTIVEVKKSISDCFSEVRVMLAEMEVYLKHIEGLKIKFIIVVCDDQKEIINKAAVFFEQALISANISSKNKYVLEIWDEEKIEELEYKLVLKF